MGTEIGQLRRAAAKLLGDGAGLKTSKAHAHLACRSAHRLHKVDEVLAGFQILAPRGDLDAGNDDLAVALCLQLTGLPHCFAQRLGADRTAGIGDDAVGAEIDAAVLHLQHSAGAACHTAALQHLELTAAQRIIHVDDAAALLHRLFQKIDKLHPLPCAGDEVDAQRLRLVGVGLHITAAGCHHRLAVALFGAADHLSGLLVADSGDRAGIDNIHVRFGLKIRQRVAAALQLLLHRRRFILIDLAAKGINSNSHRFLPCTFCWDLL